LKKRTDLIIISLLLLLATLSGCGRVHVDESMSAEEQWSLAKTFFEYENYLDAVDVLNIFTLNYSGSALIDSAQFLLGECHFALREFILAESEYLRLVQNLPQSPLVDDARLKIVLCNLYLSPAYAHDQKYTERTEVVARDFLQDFSETDLTLNLALRGSGWQTLGDVSTAGLYPTHRPDVRELPILHTKVVYARRSQGFGRWLLNVITFGIWPSPVPELRTPRSQVVDGDWVVSRALGESQARLAEKNYQTAKLYHRQSKYPSAVIYCDQVLEIYASTPWAIPALRLKGDAMYAMGRYEEAADLYDKYLKDSGARDRGRVQSRLEASLRHLQRSGAPLPDQP
jgi:outer membrane protein assembly factor BamD (BamD/ComL family)